MPFKIFLSFSSTAYCQFFHCLFSSMIRPRHVSIRIPKQTDPGPPQYSTVQLRFGSVNKRIRQKPRLALKISRIFLLPYLVMNIFEMEKGYKYMTKFKIPDTSFFTEGTATAVACSSLHLRLP